MFTVALFAYEDIFGNVNVIIYLLYKLYKGKHYPKFMQYNGGKANG